MAVEFKLESYIVCVPTWTLVDVEHDFHELQLLHF